MHIEKVFETLCALNVKVENIDRKLDEHIKDEAGKLDAVYTALFHPETGLVYLKKWMCRIATWAGIIVGASISGSVAIASIGHSLGLW